MRHFSILRRRRPTTKWLDLISLYVEIDPLPDSSDSQPKWQVFKMVTFANFYLRRGVTNDDVESDHLVLGQLHRMTVSRSEYFVIGSLPRRALGDNCNRRLLPCNLEIQNHRKRNWKDMEKTQKNTSIETKGFRRRRLTTKSSDHEVVRPRSGPTPPVRDRDFDVLLRSKFNTKYRIGKLWESSASDDIVVGPLRGQTPSAVICWLHQ